MAPGSLATGPSPLSLKLECILQAPVWGAQQPPSQLLAELIAAPKAPSGGAAAGLLSPAWLEGSLALTLLAASEKRLDTASLLLWLQGGWYLRSIFILRFRAVSGWSWKEVLALPFPTYLTGWEACGWATRFPSMGSWPQHLLLFCLHGGIENGLSSFLSHAVAWVAVLITVWGSGRSCITLGQG